MRWFQQHWVFEIHLWVCPTLHIMKYLSEPLSVLLLNCTTESRVVYKNKATQALTGNFLASLCHINETRKHYSAVLSLLPGNSGYGHCSVAQLKDLQRKKVYFMIDTHIHPQCSLFYSQKSHLNTVIHLYFRMMYTFLSLYRSAHRQAATHHSPRPVQSDTRGG